MTIEETIEQLDSVIDTYEILLGNGVNSDILDVDDLGAIKVAIASLEAWREVKAEIEDYKEKYIKLHRDWDATMIQGYDDALMVLNKHLEEVTP